ncbi:Short-chain dehydrogenase/reductase SDR [Penicillium expansum]|uniref:Short-chain dehydrogenase/reductase SDR n=1 Tax=Penicillium expansum TaxID=27334 RepID=A0A0A2IUL9_PENEN|nr:Short-chain dehydrogenase/reductase SDR [Penicillium expansum]KGO41079.1 Short-chain dehydrogenase/reductase SDR [Penicillium expansum]KGO46171.1 Short-chain dehydrogenase/reductase SDR [Penicillium expansum]KGO58854.1 Short-chain dehydrogenase/reductase SDR [Penicillium expansum]
MVSLPDVQSSNAQIASTLPAGLVAVFVGATNGIGEAALKEFARSTRSPRAYFVGRSQEAAARITAECRQLNPEGEFEFIKADVSLIKNVDAVCREIQSKEKTINILFLSCGTIRSGEDTSEGLHIMSATGYYARTRFIINLLPNLKQATSLRRVVSVLAGGHDGPIDVSDFQGKKMSMLKIRGHLVSMTDLALETLAKQAPEVTFINDYPGAVKTGIGRESNTFLAWIMNIVLMIIGPLVYIPIRESGERHLFFATSAKYPPRALLNATAEASSGVPLSEGVEVASGTDGKVGSGVYSIHWSGEHAGPKVVKLLAGLREQGMAQKVWQHTVGEFDRITGPADV